MPKIAFSSKEPSEAVADLKRQHGDGNPRVVLCFASPRYDPALLSRELKDAFPESGVFGCSTAGEIVSGQMLNNSVVAMFFNSSEVEDAGWAVVNRLRSGIDVGEAIWELESHFGRPLSSLDLEKHVGLVLIDGMSRAEERVIEQIGDRTDLFFVGGSAGDDLRFQATHVFAEGRAYTDAALLMVLKVPKGFGVLKTQSFTGTGKTLVATEVDVANRKVILFNGKPAAEAYAEAVGVAVDQAAGEFMRHPVGLMIDGKPFVRSPQRVDGGALVFYCRIGANTELEVLTGTDIVADTRAAIEARTAELGSVSAIIDFHCILRTLGLRAENRCSEYGAILADVPAIGFSTYGEAYLAHINQTSTMLLLR
jgi:hypothetical protein